MILHVLGGGFGFYFDKHDFIAVFQFNVNFKEYVICTTGNPANGTPGTYTITAFVGNS